MERKQERHDRWIDRKSVAEIGIVFTFLSVLYLNVGTMIVVTLPIYFKRHTGHKSDKISTISIQKNDRGIYSWKIRIENGTYSFFSG